MSDLYLSENVKLSQDNHGCLWLYLNDTTLMLDTLTNIELKGIAETILAFLEGDNSIE